MKPVLLTLAWACVAAALLGFTLPWVRVDLVRETELEKEFSSHARKTLAGLFKNAKPSDGGFWSKKSDKVTIPTRISGIQIPILANRRDVKVVMRLVKAFTKKDEQIGLKSYAVYLVPGLALLCGMLLAAIGSKRVIAIGVAVVCMGVAGAGFWQLLTTDTKKQFGVTVDLGLWLSLWAYVGLAYVAAIGALPERIQPRWMRNTSR